MHRAAHQVLDGGRVFDDPVAVPIVGLAPEAIAEDARAHPQRRPMRLFIACRHAFARDVLATQASSGVRQAVILGAGLDTTAYRPAERAAPIRVFEVDHPATQAWKQQQLVATGITPTTDVAYVPVDLEREPFTPALARHGLDPHRPTVFAWLGVVPYLTLDAVTRTLTAIAALPGGATVVLDYAEPRPAEADTPFDRWHRERAERVARVGEPWITFFTPPDLHTLLLRTGFAEIEDLGIDGYGPRYLGLPANAPRRPGGHLVAAGTAGHHHPQASPAAAAAGPRA